MKKIRWQKTSDWSYIAKVGVVRLMCRRDNGRTWKAHAHVLAICGTRHASCGRKSLERAKNDAVELARGYLQDLQDGMAEAIEYLVVESE